jgi:hypothetical protein
MAFELDVPFEAGLVLTRFGGRWTVRAAAAAAELTSSSTRADRKLVVEWAEWIRKAARHLQPLIEARLWSKYVDLASELLDV